MAEAPDKKAETASSGNTRTEEYKAVRPDGSEVTIRRNIDTGESKIK